MLILGVIAVFQPFLQLAVLPNLHRRKAVYHLLQFLLERFILSKDARSQQRVAQRIENDLIVHCASGRHRAMFGRHRRRHHPPMIGRMFHEEIQEELRRAFQHRIIGFQEILITGEQVVLPQVLSQPSPSGRPHASRRKVHRAGNAPQVGIVMRHPSATFIHVAGGLGTRHRQVFQHGEQRLVHLAQVGHLCRPIVHFRVNVDGVFAVPRRVRTAVPNALQIGGLPAGLRRGYQQITPVLEQQGGQRLILTLLEVADTHISFLLGSFIGLSIAQSQLHPVEQAFVIGHMVFQRLFVGHLHGLREITFRPGSRIAAHIMVVHEIRSCRDIQSSFLCSGHFQGVARSLHFAVRHDLHTAFRPQRGLHPFLVTALAKDGQLAAFCLHLMGQRSFIADAESQGTRLAGLHSHDDHAVGERSESRAGIVHPIHFIACGGRGIGNVQITIIICGLVMAGEIQKQIAHGHITHAMFPCKEIGIHQVLCIPILILEYQLPHDRKHVTCILIVIVIRPSGPKRLFIELELLTCRTAIHHRPHAGITDGKGIRPITGRLTVPQLQILCKSETSHPCEAHTNKSSFHLSISNSYFTD